MPKYPTLSEMDIKNPGQIERYTLNTTNNVDVLRITYKRKKGSLLPTSKRFEFGRSQKSIVADSGSEKTETVHEISPFLKKAIEELDQIIGAKKSNLGQARLVKEEIRQLRKDMQDRLDHIESLVDAM